MTISDRILQKIQRTFYDLIANLGLEHLVLNSKKGGAILCYHGIDNSGNKDLNYRHISKSMFEQHLIYFRKFFHIISVDDYFHERFSSTKFNIALTFDDGYLNNYTNAYPLIKKYQIPASFYITGMNNLPQKFIWSDFVDLISKYIEIRHFEIEGEIFHKKSGKYYNNNGLSLGQFIKTNTEWDWKKKLFEKFTGFEKIINQFQVDEYWKIMTDEQIIEMSQSPLITIGSHGYYHNNLGNIPLSTAISEVNFSKAYIEGIIQKNIDEIAFPDGSYTHELSKELVNIGFTKQLALKYNFDTDVSNSYLLNRHDLYPVHSVINQMVSIPNLQ